MQLSCICYGHYYPQTPVMDQQEFSDPIILAHIILNLSHPKLNSGGNTKFQKVQFQDTVQLGDTNLTARSSKDHTDTEKETKSYGKTMGRKQPKRKTGAVLQILKTVMISIIREPSFQQLWFPNLYNLLNSKLLPTHQKITFLSLLFSQIFFKRVVSLCCTENYFSFQSIKVMIEKNLIHVLQASNLRACCSEKAGL